MITLLRSARKLRRVLETCCHSNSRERSSADAGGKNSYRSKVIIIIIFQKDPLKGTAPNNYKPITCLPMMWKILTAQIREDIYYS